MLVLPLSAIKPNPGQPRKIFDSQALAELAQSIRHHGVLQPILVKRVGNGYSIVSGERRYRACCALGLDSIPALVRPMDDRETLLAGLIENLQREDLNPVEEAETLRDIVLRCGLTHDQLAEQIGRSRSALTNRLRILQLPDDVRQMVVDGRLTAGHAKMLAGLADAAEMRTFAKKITREGWSVFETERQIARAKDLISRPKPVAGSKERGNMTKDIHLRATEESLQEMLGAKVRIRQGKARSRLEIEFYSKDDLDRVIETMVSCRW